MKNCSPKTAAETASEARNEFSEMPSVDVAFPAALSRAPLRSVAADDGEAVADMSDWSVLERPPKGMSIGWTADATSALRWQINESVCAQGSPGQA